MFSKSQVQRVIDGLQLGECGREKYKIIIMTILLLSVVGILLYFHIYLKQGIIFTHFFYIPVVLATFWWRRKGLLLVAGLGGLLIASSLLFLRVDLINNVMRSLMFLAVGSVVTFLSEWIAIKEENMKQSEERFRALFENIGDGVAIFKAENDGNDFTFLDFNKAGESIEKITRHDVIGRNVVDLFPGIKKFGLFDVLQTVWKSGVSQHFPVALYKDERITGWRDNFVYKLPSGEIVTVYRDETERKQMEEALRESEQELKTVLEGSPIPTFVINRDHIVQYWNKALEELSGTRAHNVTGTKEHWKALYNEERATLVDLLVDERFSELPKWYSGKFHESQIITGAYEAIDFFPNLGVEGKWLRSTASILRNSKGHIVGAIETLEDITDRKNAEDSLHERTEDLERSNEELEKFAYVASHDLQEPLRMVSSYMQLLSRRYGGKIDADADEFIGFAVDGAKRMQILINDLLTYSRIGTRGREFEPVPCEEVLGLALVNLLTVIEETGSVVTHDELPTVLADKTQLVQLFQNLISNAIKFRSNEQPRVHVHADHKENEWIFSIKDNGIGIDPRYEDRIFEVFQRLHGRGQYSGTGIGLAICKKIVERHGGSIRVQSEEGTGATFYFSLPEIQHRSLSE
jgi:signal transduction histidine kinase